MPRPIYYRHPHYCGNHTYTICIPPQDAIRIECNHCDLMIIDPKEIALHVENTRHAQQIAEINRGKY